MGAQGREFLGVWWAGNRRMGEKLCAWVAGMQLMIRRAKTAEEGQGRKERLIMVVGYSERAVLSG
jgi:hypothetical protein